MTATAMLSVRVLGGLSLELEGRRLPAPGGRCGSLLAWLALHEGMQPRSRVAAKLWPEVLDECARRSLRTALLDLRRALGSDAECHLHATRDEIGLGGAEEVWVDIRAFRAAVAAGDLQRALALGVDELLPAVDHEWAFDARSEHQRDLIGIVDQLAAHAEQRGDLSAAIEHTRRLVAMDSLAEEPARALIRRLAAAGDRAAALTAFERHRDRLRTVLRVTPSAPTRELVDKIRGDEPGAAAAVRYRAVPSAGRLRRRGACL